MKRTISKKSFTFFSGRPSKKRTISKSGQVWVETVIYTLIGLAIMGLVLAIAKPKIEEKKDEIKINQAIEALETINDKIYEVQRAAGNRRAVDLEVGSGKVVIDVDNDKISWILDLSFAYSEPGVSISLGSLNVTTKQSSPYEVTLESNYAADLIYSGVSGGTKNLDATPTPYTLVIENLGKDELTGELQIELRDA